MLWNYVPVIPHKFMHNSNTSHLYEAFHLQSILCPLGNSSFQHTYEEGKYSYLHFTDRETERDKSSIGIIRRGL